MDRIEVESREARYRWLVAALAILCLTAIAFRGAACSESPDWQKNKAEKQERAK